MKTPTTLMALAVVLAAVFLHSAVDGFKCYQGDKDKKELRECRLAGTNFACCQEITTRFSDGGHVFKQYKCLAKTLCENVGLGCKTHDTSNTRQKTCTCDSEGCNRNGATTATPAMLAMAAGGLLLLLLDY